MPICPLVRIEKYGIFNVFKSFHQHFQSINDIRVYMEMVFVAI